MFSNFLSLYSAQHLSLCRCSLLAQGIAGSLNTGNPTKITHNEIEEVSQRKVRCYNPKKRERMPSRQIQLRQNENSSSSFLLSMTICPSDLIDESLKTRLSHPLTLMLLSFLSIYVLLLGNVTFTASLFSMSPSSGISVPNTYNVQATRNDEFCVHDIIPLFFGLVRMN